MYISFLGFIELLGSISYSFSPDSGSVLILFIQVFFLPLPLPLLSSLKSNYTYITILDVVKKTSEACSEDFSSVRPLSVP